MIPTSVVIGVFVGLVLVLVLDFFDPGGWKNRSER